MWTSRGLGVRAAVDEYGGAAARGEPVTGARAIASAPWAGSSCVPAHGAASG
ncbi:MULTISPECIES: hypothetical protein [unclassified Streptomyces]|uniref:hypothetical protein n=1 Tax=unclassified Streptomyces TaxID=2593676 RepID=UPI00131403A6|nr:MULTISPECIES: hypothetical protein [unclassified Streptomyces]